MAHEAVVSHETWFGDGEPLIGEQYTAAKAKERKPAVIKLLFRAA